MLMRIGRVKEEALFYTITLATFVLLLVLSILFLTRESRHNREMLETETVRLAGDLIEALGQRPFLSPQELRPDVLGFGVYGPDGKAVNRFGSAPENGWTLVPETERLRGRINRIEFKDDRLVILRTLGFPFMDRDSMWGMRRGRMRGELPPPMEPFPPPGRLIYLEMDIRDWKNQQRAIQYGFYLVPFLLVAIFAGTTLLYRKNLAYRRNEEKNRELVRLGEAARTLAHEIKNPLGVIRIQTGTLQKVLPAEYHKNLKVITEEVDRLRLLVDRVGEFLKNPAGDPIPVAVTGVVGELVQRFSFPIVYSSPLKERVWVKIDRHRFRTVLENLMKNAVESLTEAQVREAGSQKNDNLSAESDPSISVEVLADEKQVEIRVLDRGTGLPPNAGERIYDPFFTTKPTGSGIGLAVSKGFVEAAGGSLEVKPRTSGGTEARVVLPRFYPNTEE
jgi:signal transduction histidine kinase